ncbi:MAG: hypothetical protein ACQR33_04170 [Candidatus Saccharibacteria bacterium]
MKIFSAVLVATFGQGRRRPKFSAYMRLGLLGMTSVILGACLAHSTQSVALPRWPSAGLLFLAIVLGVQLVVVATLAGSQAIMGQSTTIPRLLTILPLSGAYRRVLTWLPQLALVVCVLVVILPTLYRICSMAGTAPVVTLVAIVTGVASGFGMVFSFSMRPFMRTCSLLLIGWVEIWLTNHSENLAYTPSQRLPYVCAQSFVLCLLCGSLWFATDTPRSVGYPRSLPLVRFPLAGWFITKVVRSYTGSRSLAYTFVISALVALAAKHVPGIDATLLYGTATLLAASCAADLRCLSRTDKPPEIVGLRGTGYYCRAEVGGLFLASLATLPIIITALVSTPSSQAAVRGLLEIGMGAATGNLAGTALAHEGRDISSQFTAIFLSMGVLWIAQRLFSSATHVPAVQLLGELTCTALLLGATYYIERNRNPFRWRYKHE